MNSYVCTRALALAAAALLSGCGPSALSLAFSDAVAKQAAVDSASVNIFVRSPGADAGNFNLTAVDERTIERLTKTPTSLNSFNSKTTALRSPDLIVYQSDTTLFAPTIFDWAGENLSWKNPNFQIFMAYAHGQIALNYMKKNFATTYADMRLNGHLPLTIYAAIDLNVFRAKAGKKYQLFDIVSFNPSAKSIRFGRDPSTAAPRYNPVDEADALYHEMGHSLQQGLNPLVLAQGVGSNNAMDALLEGLADFFAASILRDDNFGRYLQSNFTVLTGDQHIRRMDHSLSYPGGWLDESHLSGRVVASALNDLRRYLQGQTISLLNCSTQPCTVTAVSTGFSTAKAFDLVNVLAHQSFVSFATTGTIHGFMTRLLTTCTGTFSDWCSASIATDFRKILVGRGVVSDYTANVAVSGDSAAVGYLKQNVSSASGDDGSTTAGKIGPCERVLIFPNISGVDGASDANRAALYDGVAIVTAFNSDIVPYAASTANSLSSSNSKRLPWIEPADRLQGLLRSPASRLYTAQQGSTYTSGFDFQTTSSDVGWIVNAPDTAGTYNIYFQIQYRAFNKLTSVDTGATITVGGGTTYRQSFVVSATTGTDAAIDYCN